VEVRALLRSARVDAITLFADDLERSKLFYQDVFGLAVAFEDEHSVVFKFENTIINLLKIPAARELIEPGAEQCLRPVDRPGRGVPSR
jgi:catechol-2,3-dioxygenase